MNMDETTEKMMQEWCMWDTWIWMCEIQHLSGITSLIKSKETKNSNQIFWIWETKQDISMFELANVKQNTATQRSFFNPIQHLNESTLEPVKPRKRAHSLPDIDENMQKILKLSNENIMLSFEHLDKSARGLHKGLSQRRSLFIGVIRNRKRWQVLINGEYRKHYIGTYWSEVEAAIVHDF